MLCSQKYNLTGDWGLQQLREVWTKNYDFEKQMFLVNESDKTTVRPSPSQSRVDQLEVHTHVKRTYPILMSLGCGDSSMVALDLITLKSGMNTT